MRLGQSLKSGGRGQRKRGAVFEGGGVCSVDSMTSQPWVFGVLDFNLRKQRESKENNKTKHETWNHYWHGDSNCCRLCHRWRSWQHTTASEWRENVRIFWICDDIATMNLLTRLYIHTYGRSVKIITITKLWLKSILTVKLTESKDF